MRAYKFKNTRHVWHIASQASHKANTGFQGATQHNDTSVLSYGESNMSFERILLASPDKMDERNSMSDRKSLSAKMTVDRSVDPGRDPSGFPLVTLVCPTCERKKNVRKVDVHKRNVCRHCEAEVRFSKGLRVRRKRRENANKTASGSALGGLNRYAPVFMYVESDSYGSVRLILSNKNNRRAPAGCSSWCWAFPDGKVPLMVLDTYGREVEGEAARSLLSIAATVDLLKGG